MENASEKMPNAMPEGPGFMMDTVVCERPMFDTGYDVFSVHWTNGHYTVGQEPIIHDIEDWEEELRIPDLNKLDWEPARASAQQMRDMGLPVTATLMMGPFERATTLTSYTDCMMNLGEEPELFADMIRVLADYRIAEIRKLHEVTGVEELLIHDDWGCNLSLLMSPATWRQVMAPSTKRIYDACHELGIRVIQHSCGKVQDVLGDIVEMGVDGFQIQSDCNDIPTIKALYGDRVYIDAWTMLTEDALMGKESEVGPPPMEVLSADQTSFKEKPEWLYA